MEKRVYNGYAFSENEGEKARINYSIHKELTERHDVYRDDIRFNPEVNLDEYHVVIGRKPGYAHAVYNIVKNEPNLSTNELLLLCDGGNLCFGGSRISDTELRVSED